MMINDWLSTKNWINFENAMQKLWTNLFSKVSLWYCKHLPVFSHLHQYSASFVPRRPWSPQAWWPLWQGLWLLQHPWREAYWGSTTVVEEVSALSLLCEDIARRQPSTNHKRNPYQTVKLLTPLSWTSQPLELQEIHICCRSHPAYDILL